MMTQQNTHSMRRDLAVIIWFSCWIMLWIFQTIVLSSLVLTSKWDWLEALDSGVGKILIGIFFLLFAISIYRASMKLSPLPGIEIYPENMQFQEIELLESHLIICMVILSIESLIFIVWGLFLVFGVVEYAKCFTSIWGKVIFLLATVVPFLGWFVQHEGETSAMAHFRISRVKEEQGKLYGLLYFDFGFLYGIVGLLEVVIALGIFALLRK
jgi:hypothetical protein